VEDKPIKEEKAIPPSDTCLITENHYAMVKVWEKLKEIIE